MMTSFTCRFPLQSMPPASLLSHPVATAFQNPKSTAYGRPLQCGVIHKPRHRLEYINASQSDGTQKDASKESNIKKKKLVDSIRLMLQSIDDGETTVSPYDTAWVAMVEDVNGGGAPQFPSSLDWIANNQIFDGSWGDKYIFSIYDRVINTLGCVIALRKWNVHLNKIDKGISFIKGNIHKLEDENIEHMPIAFEVVLPSLIEIAKKLDIDVPYDAPCLQEIYKRRELKLARIPRDMMYKMSTTLLFNLEGMPADLNWEKLLKLQSADGSFLFSPASTAFALNQTKDENCLKYLTKIVQKFNGGVPNAYPVDLFERIWAVDRLQRLGISRYFQTNVEECVDYVHRYWTDKGICWARNSELQDIDDTAMGFRLLRLHGYDISADVFKNFEKNGEFFCFAGQLSQAVTGMYNLYRASQLMFPGEDILANAGKFAAKFLQEKRANNELLDKWIISKDLPGEVGYALDMPWYASLPRVETRFYLEQYGGERDVWIGKILYSMPCVNNNAYLELAKLDYNDCQALHQEELRSLQKWYRNCSLEEFGLDETGVLQAYFMASTSIFEPERSLERIAWAKTAVLVESLLSHFDQHHLSAEQKRDLVNEFENATALQYTNGARYKTRTTFVRTLVGNLKQLSLDFLLAHGRDIHPHLISAWRNWLNKWKSVGQENFWRQGEAELYINVLILASSSQPRQPTSEELQLQHPEYQRLLKATATTCDLLRQFEYRKDATVGMTTVEIELSMQQVVKLAITDCHLDRGVKQSCLTVARSFYYAAYCNKPETKSFHITKVLFERAT